MILSVSTVRLTTVRAASLVALTDAILASLATTYLRTKTRLSVSTQLAELTNAIAVNLRVPSSVTNVLKASS